MVEFRIKEHQSSPRKVVELVIDGNVIAVIYPEGEQGIRILSAHYDGEPFFNNGEMTFPPIPSVHAKFQPRKWAILGNKIVREGDPDWDAAEFEIKRGLRQVPEL